MDLEEYLSEEHDLLKLDARLSYDYNEHELNIIVDEHNDPDAYTITTWNYNTNKKETNNKYGIQVIEIVEDADENDIE